MLSGITSILCLAAISLERSVAVKFPSTHMNLSKRPVMIAIFATWIIGLIQSVSKYGVPFNLLPISIYTASIFALGFVVPLFVIIASYCIIFYAALHMMKSSNESVSTLRELRVAKTISLVIGLFIICWSPFFIVNMIYVFCNHCAKPKWPIYVSKVMHYTNSMVNFFVYSARSPDFSNFFKKVLCPPGRKKCNQKNINKSRTFSAMSDTSRFTYDSTLYDSSKSVLLRSQQRRSVEIPFARQRLPTILDNFDQPLRDYVIP